MTPAAGDPSCSLSPCPSGHRCAHSVCLQCVPTVLSAAITGLLPFLAAPTFRPYQLSRSFSTQRRWGSTRELGHGAGPVPCQDVPAPSLTCPARPPLPVPPGTMGGCFSKPKPGDCSPDAEPPSHCARGRNRSAVDAGQGNVNARLLQGGLLGF